MLTEYLKSAMKKARYEKLGEDNFYYGEIPEFEGVYTHEPTLEGCRAELESVLEDWILFSISRHLPLPVMDGMSLEIKDIHA